MEKKKEISVETTPKKVVNDNKKTFNYKRFFGIVIEAIIIMICIAGAIFIFINPSTTRSDPSKFNTTMMVVETDSMEPTIMTKNMIFSNKFEYDENTILDIGTVVTYYVQVGDYYNLNTHRIVGYKYEYFNENIPELNGQYKEYGSSTIVSFEDLKHKYDYHITFVGYITRGDNITLKEGASIGEYTIYKSNGSVNEDLDDKFYSGYITNELILSTWSGKQSSFLGNIVYFLGNHNNTLLFLVLPIVLLILYNLFLVIKEIVNDKKTKAKEDTLKAINEKNKLEEEEIKKQAIKEYLASLNKKEDGVNGEEDQEES